MAGSKDTSGFSAEERAAMKARAAELRAEARAGRGGKKAEAEAQALADEIAKMAEPDRSMAARLDELIAEHAPTLAGKTWYGQPAWALDGKVVAFFRSGAKDGDRYSTFGFQSAAALDDPDGLWATGFALTELTPAAEKSVIALLKKAVP